MVFYDQPGHGRSGSWSPASTTCPRSARRSRAVIDETVPDGPIVLVGHSMGGMTIMAFAEQYPELFGDRVAGVGADLHLGRPARRDQVRPARR